MIWFSINPQAVNGDDVFQINPSLSCRRFKLYTRWHQKAVEFWITPHQFLLRRSCITLIT